MEKKRDITFELHAIDCLEDPMTMEPALHELSFVFGAVWKSHYPDSVGKSLLKLAIEGGAVG